MDLKTVFANNLNLQNLIYIAVRVIMIAVVFEFIAWWLGTRIEKLTAPLIPVDAEREQHWRIRRRATLRQTPKIITRSLCYTVGLILVFEIFGVPVLALSIAVGAVFALFGTALLPLLRDATQGYALLAEDTLAIGDEVIVNGHQGTVEKFTLRGLWLRDKTGHAHCLSNRDVHDVVVLQRRAEPAAKREPGTQHDPGAQREPGTK